MLITGLWAQIQQAAYEKGLGDYEPEKRSLYPRSRANSGLKLRFMMRGVFL